MSGGAYLHAYRHVEDMADAMLTTPGGLEDVSPYRVWFREHLHHVATAMKAVEWEDSGDTEAAATVQAIQDVIDHAAI